MLIWSRHPNAAKKIKTSQYYTCAYQCMSPPRCFSNCLLSMAERLIGCPPLAAHGPELMSVVCLVVGQSPLKGTAHPLVIIGHLLPPEEATTTTLLVALGFIVVAFDPITPPAAAARAEQPEQPRRHGEDDPQPGGHIDVLPQRAVDVILVQGGVETPGEGGIQNGGRQGKREDEETRHDRHDGGEQAAQTTEEGEKTDEDLDDGGDERDHVGDEHPLGHGAVGVEPGFQLLAEELVHAGVVQPPDVDRVEPELVRVRGAEGHVVAAPVAARPVRDEGALAVVPERDVVEVADAQRLLGDPLGRVEELARVEAGDVREVGDVRGGDVDVGRVGSEEKEVVVPVVRFVGAAQPHYDQADEGADGEDHGGEDAGETAGFAHDGGGSTGSTSSTVVGWVCDCRLTLQGEGKSESRKRLLLVKVISTEKRMCLSCLRRVYVVRNKEWL